MKRCVIVGGADINNYDYVRSRLCADDYIVFCDSGLKHLDALQVRPGLIVGDFDSHDNLHLDIETIVLPCEKDDTDTVFAVKEAIKRGFDDFLFIGVVGARLTTHSVTCLSLFTLTRLVRRALSLTITRKWKSSQKNLHILMIHMLTFHF